MPSVEFFDYSEHFCGKHRALLSQRWQLDGHYETPTREAIFKSAEIFPKKTASAEQIHSSFVKAVESAGTNMGVDGLITQNPNLPLLLRVADCVPVFLFAEDISARALVHSGWRGTVAGIVPNTLKKMAALGASAENLRAVLGASITIGNFEVGREVYDKFRSENCRIHNGKMTVSVVGEIRQQLVDFGIPKHHIFMDETCTFEDARCESYRRDGESSGRMMAIFG